MRAGTGSLLVGFLSLPALPTEEDDSAAEATMSFRGLETLAQEDPFARATKCN